MAPPTDGGFHQVQADQEVIPPPTPTLQGPAGLTFCRFFCRGVRSGLATPDDQDRPKVKTAESLSDPCKQLRLERLDHDVENVSVRIFLLLVVVFLISGCTGYTDQGEELYQRTGQPSMISGWRKQTDGAI
jgi:hypothetical protein